MSFQPPPVDILRATELRFWSIKIRRNPIMKQKKLKTLPSLILLVCALVSALPTAGLAQRPSPSRASAARAGGASQAKLVVVIMIDQFRYDFVERFWDVF